jgi:hypothetical protein
MSCSISDARLSADFCSARSNHNPKIAERADGKPTGRSSRRPAPHLARRRRD